MTHTKTATTTLYPFRGVDRRGIDRIGTLESRRGPAAFTELRFKQGWRSLSVLLETVEVAGIATTTDGRRTWWAEA